MATGKITVAAPNRKGVVGRQQEAYNRQLESAARFTERTTERATNAAQRAYQRSGEFRLENIIRVSEQTDAANERFLRSRLEQFKDARQTENQIWSSQQRLALQQRQQRRDQDLSIKKDLDNYNNTVRVQNLKSLAQISETASQLVDDVTKKYIEGIVDREYTIGISEVSPFGLKPEQAKVLDTAQQVMAKAATDEGVANDAEFEVNPIGAEDKRRTSPQLTGWAAYGRALGRIEAAKGNWATALDVFIHSSIPSIPDPDNPNQLLSPREMARKGPAQAMAALEVGNQQLLEMFGLKGVNPALIAKELGETVNGVTAAIARNIITEDRALDKQNQIEEITSQMSTSYRSMNPADSTTVTRYFNNQVNRLAPLVGGRGEANEVVVDRLIELAVATKDPLLLGSLEVANVSETDPGLGTIGDRYGDKFERATDRLERKQYEDEQRHQEEMETLLTKIQDDHRSDLVAAGTDKEAIKKANQDFRNRLMALADEETGGSEKARELLTQEITKPITSTDQMFGILMEHHQKTGELPSDDELQAFVDDGSLTESEARNLSARRGENLGAGIARDLAPQIRALTNKVFIEDVVQAAGLNSIGALGTFGVDATQTLADEVITFVEEFVNSKPEGSLTTTQIRGAAIQRAKELVKLRNYQIRTREVPLSNREQARLGGKKAEIVFDGPVMEGGLANRLVASAPNSRSPSGLSRDLRGERPEVVSGLMTERDIVFRDQEIDSALEALKAGLPLPSRVVQLSQATGRPAAELVQDQARLSNGTTLDINTLPGQQPAVQALTVVPSEAAIMSHPNVPDYRRSRSFQRLQAAQNLRQQREANAQAQANLAAYNAMGIPDPPARWQEQSGLSGVGERGLSRALSPFLNLLKEGESRSSGEYNAIAGSRTGDARLTSMTIREALQLGGNRALGAYQFIPSTLKAALPKAGLTMNDTFSVENQDRLATAWILNGQRPRLSAYIRGESNDLAAAVNDAGVEWAALEQMSGRGYWDGDGRNQSSISSGRVAQALQQARRNFLQARTQASSPISSPVLQTLGSTNRLSAERDTNGQVIKGLCTTNVLKTLELNGIPQPYATGNDPGNNPRGGAVQFINNFGWKSLQVPGSRSVTLNSPGYGKATVNQMSLQQYRQAVGRGQIPSGALVFQTKHSSWNSTSDRSRGFDMAIARNGGSQLFNGELLPDSVYGPSTTHIFVLVPSN